MTTYHLTAEGSGMKRRHTFTARDDFDATTHAIDHVLDHAVGNVEPWANGHIVLSTGKRGLIRVVHEMGPRNV